MHTKKVGTAGRFGPRYGTTLRKEVAAIEKRQKAKHDCPSCRKDSLRRVTVGVWECSACGKKFTGGAYYPSTGAVRMLKKSMAGALAAQKGGV